MGIVFNSATTGLGSLPSPTRGEIAMSGQLSGQHQTDATGAPAPRTTRQRRAVVAVLGDFDDFRSAQEIHGLLRRSDEKVGLTTVYRALQSLAESGEVDTLRTEDGEALYRRCSTTHHHHLVCGSCGR